MSERTRVTVHSGSDGSGAVGGWCGWCGCGCRRKSDCRGSPFVLVVPVVGVGAVVVAASGSGGSGGVGSCGCLHTTARHNILRIVPH